MFERRRSGMIPVFGFGLAIAIIALDQATKAWMLYGLDLINQVPGERVEVFSFFHLTMVWNRGISFGFLPAQAVWQTWLLIMFSVAVSGLLVVWMRDALRWLQASAYALIIGGAIGNAIDRAIYGAVADFLDFSDLPRITSYNVCYTKLLRLVAV